MDSVKLKKLQQIYDENSEDVLRRINFLLRIQLESDLNERVSDDTLDSVYSNTMTIPRNISRVMFGARIRMIDMFS